MGFIISLIVGGILGWLASLIIGKDIPGGIIGNIIAGVVGSWLGTAIFGNMGPTVAGYAIIPALIGAIILIFIVSMIMKAVSRSA